MIIWIVAIFGLQLFLTDVAQAYLKTAEKLNRAIFIGPRKCSTQFLTNQSSSSKRSIYLPKVVITGLERSKIISESSFEWTHVFLTLQCYTMYLDKSSLERILRMCMILFMSEMTSTHIFVEIRENVSLQGKKWHKLQFSGVMIEAKWQPANSPLNDIHFFLTLTFIPWYFIQCVWLLSKKILWITNSQILHVLSLYVHDIPGKDLEKIRRE